MPAHTLGGVLYLEEGRGRRMVVRGKRRMGKGERREKSRVSYKWVYFYMKNVSLNFPLIETSPVCVHAQYKLIPAL